MKKFFPPSSTDFHIEGTGKDEQITVIHSTDVSGNLDIAKGMRDFLDGKSTLNEEMRPVMEIDDILIEKYCFDKGITWAEFWSTGENQKHIKAILHDPDLSGLRLRRAFSTQK